MNEWIYNLFPLIIAIVILLAILYLIGLFVLPKDYKETQKVRLELIKKRQRAEELERMTLGEDDEV